MHSYSNKRAVFKNNQREKVKEDNLKQQGPVETESSIYKAFYRDHAGKAPSSAAESWSYTSSNVYMSL